MKITPYNPPGLNEYIRKGMRKNSQLLNKPTPTPTISPEARELANESAKLFLRALNGTGATGEDLERLIQSALDAQHNRTVEVCDNAARYAQATGGNVSRAITSLKRPTKGQL